MVQRIQREVSLRKLPLPQPRAEGIDRVVATRDVLSEIEPRSELNPSQSGR
jgi:hypothetical protein